MSPLSVILLLPLIAAAAVWFLAKWPNARETVSVLISVIVFVAVVAQVSGVAEGGRPETVLMALPHVPGVPRFELVLRLEPLGMLFAVVASGLWIATTCYSIGYMRAHHESHQTRFYSCFALAIFAALGAALAGNMLTLFVFYEILTLSTIPLVMHHGTEDARRGGRIYASILLSTSIGLLLLAVVWTWSLAGTLDFRDGGILRGKASPQTLAWLLALYAFGTGKAALMPFHRWLPAAMVAPTPVSALLHAVAVVKVGVFTILKVVVYIFGIDLLNTSGASDWLTYVAAATILIASIVALTKDNLKARLAYSTVSQLSYIVLGAALANRWGVIGGGMHIAMHAVGKITLFFCAGAIYVAAHKTEISDMRGIGRRMPVTLAAFFVAAVSIIGLPPCGGTWSKWWLALGAAERSEHVLIAVLMLSSLLNVAYLMPIVIQGFFSRPPETCEWDGIHEAPYLCVVPLCATAVLSVALFFSADFLFGFLEPITRG